MYLNIIFPIIVEMGWGLPNMLESKGLVGNIPIMNDFIPIIHRMTPFSFLFTPTPLESRGLIKINIPIFRNFVPLIHKTFALFFLLVFTLNSQSVSMHSRTKSYVIILFFLIFICSYCLLLCWIMFGFYKDDQSYQDVINKVMPKNIHLGR